jgi:streptogramin lyase
MPEGGPNNGGGGNGGADGGVNGGSGGTDEPDAQAGAGGADEPDADAGPGGSGGEGGDGGDGGGGTGGVPDLPDVFIPDLDAGPDASDADADIADAAEAGPPPFDPGPPGTLVEFPLPVIEGGAISSNGESRIAVGSDDKLYVTDTGMAVLYRMDVEGNVEEFALAPSSQPRGITLGPDGNVWFVQYGNDKIGRITPSGTITEFSIPNVPIGGSGPNGITLGQDGNLWYTEQKGSRVGRIAVTPVDGGYDVNITPLNLPATGRFPKDITRGPDGDNHIWFTEQIGRVAKVTTGLFIDSTMEYGNGVITSAPLGIVNGPDGNLWFTEVADLVGQSDTSGTITEHGVDTSGCVPLSITVGSDDMLWYTCYQHSMLGRTDPGDPGNPESHTLFANSEPTGIVSGPGGALWFVDEGLRSVGYMVPPL